MQMEHEMSCLVQRGLMSRISQSGARYTSVPLMNAVTKNIWEEFLSLPIFRLDSRREVVIKKNYSFRS